MSSAEEISRRTFLGGIAGLAGGLILGACAPTSTPAPSRTGSAASEPPAATPTGPSQAPPTAPPPSPSPTGLPLRQRIARMLVVGFRGLTLDDAPWLRKAIAEDGLGGVILFDRDQITGGARNVRSPDQVRELIADLKALAPDRELIVAIDQEGGVVTRLSPKYGYPAVESQAVIAAKGLEAVESWAEQLTMTLADAGINLNLAPVVDLNVNPGNPAIGALNRAFSPDPTIVINDASVEISSHRLRGVRTAVKHFPGLGSATVNTDFGVADVTNTWTDRELEPYRVLLEQGSLDLVMVGNLVNGQLDDSAPASLSQKTVTGLLRGKIGFGGPVITDDLQAAAIAGSFGAKDTVRLAIEAGDDLLLFANQQAYDEGIVGTVLDIAEALVGDGTIDEGRIDRSVARIEGLFAPRG